MTAAWQLERWLAWEVHGRKLRKPPQRASVLSHKPARDYKFRAWIRSLPSAASGLSPCQACHTGPHAIGQKASDYSCIPLTADEHRAYDRDPKGFAKQHGLDVPELTARLTRIWFLAKREEA
jgi:hypothetical protein